MPWLVEDNLFTRVRGKAGGMGRQQPDKGEHLEVLQCWLVDFVQK